MHPAEERRLLTRREYLTTAASGIGGLALSSLLHAQEAATNPLAPRAPHIAPKTKACIAFFLEGAPSQLDLFDPKPKLNAMHGEKLPESMLKNVRFAFIQKESVKLMGTKRKFTRHGQCGMELSDLLPNLGKCADDLLLVRSLHTDQFNHHPGQLMMQCGRPTFGLPCMGSWITYGLGSVSQNLPGYVVLMAGRGNSGGATIWQSGFLPTVYSGVLFRSKGEAVLDLANPPGIAPELQREGLDALRDLNEARHREVHDPEIASRIASYELAYRMQSAAPELIDLSNEPQYIRDLYGVDRADLPIKADRGGGPGQYRGFATSCLLARRLVERGVRFVNIVHASWDHHSNLDNELTFNAGMADQPVSALIQDLKQRGLLDSTLILWLAEFGRTPLGENRQGYKEVTGRDHHPFAFSAWMAGGGIKGGQVYGETDELGWGIARDPVHINDLHATILHLFGLDHLKLTHRFQGRDFRLTDVAGRVIPDWLA
jgi:hypothetical protein